MILATALLQLLGLAMIAVTMPGAPPSIRLRTSRSTRWVKRGGWGLLALSCATALGGGRAGLMILSWFGLLSVTSALVLLACTALRRSVR